MTKKNELTSQQAIQFAHLQVWAMSFVCGLLCLLAVAAATRIPHYLDTLEYVRLSGVILFGLLVLAGVVDNIRTHLCLWRLKNETVSRAS